MTAVLTDENGKTRLTLTALYPSLDVRDAVLKTGMARGAAIRRPPGTGGGPTQGAVVSLLTDRRARARGPTTAWVRQSGIVEQ